MWWSSSRDDGDDWDELDVDDDCDDVDDVELQLDCPPPPFGTSFFRFVRFEPICLDAPLRNVPSSLSYPLLLVVLDEDCWAVVVVVVVAEFTLLPFVDSAAV